MSLRAVARQHGNRGAGRTRFPSVNALSEFSHNQGRQETKTRAPPQPPSVSSSSKADVICPDLQSRQIPYTSHPSLTLTLTGQDFVEDGEHRLMALLIDEFQVVIPDSPTPPRVDRPIRVVRGLKCRAVV